MTQTNDQAPQSYDSLAGELRREELGRCLSGEDAAKREAFEEAQARFDRKGDMGQELLSPECGRRYALLKLLVQENGGLRWQALKEWSLKERTEKARDRKEPSLWDADAQVLKLWQELEGDFVREGSAEISELARHRWSVVYHRHWLFDWFLSRYDIRRARQVLGGGAWSRNAHALLAAAILVVLFFHLAGRLEPLPALSSVSLSLLIYSLVVAALGAGFRARVSDWPEAIALALHSLIPRLAGAGAVGLVILASSQELLRAVVETGWWWLVGLLLAGYGYLLLEMARRVYPSPPLPRLLCHGADIAATALAHSMTLALLAEGGLRRVLKNEPGEIADPFSCWELFSVVVFVFTIGLVVNLIWAEQPVTEPL